MPAVTFLKLPQVINLTLTANDTGAVVMNYPVNRTDFRVFKGTRNDIDIFVRDVDRKPVDLTGRTITVVIVQHSSAAVLLERAATIVTPATAGRCRLTITAGDCAAWDNGVLHYSLLISNSDGTSSALYTDRDYRHAGVIHVEQGPYPAPLPPITITPTDFIMRSGSAYAGAYPAAMGAGLDDGLNTLQVFTTGFSGTLTVQASLALQPTQDDIDWFDASTQTMTLSTGTTAFNVMGNYLWLRIKLTTLVGTVDRLLIRTG